MRLLLCLAQRPGELVSIGDLLERVWSGVYVTPDSVYQAVASLRRVLGDDPKQPFVYSHGAAAGLSHGRKGKSGSRKLSGRSR